MGSRAHFMEHLTDLQGNALSGASITLRDQGTTDPISETIFVADDPDAAVHANPLTADATGKIEFYLAAAKRLDLFIEKPGFAAKTVTVDVLKLPTNIAVKDEGILLPSRGALNISGASVEVTDDAGNDELDVVILGTPGEYAGTAEIADIALAEAAGASGKVARGDHVHAHPVLNSGDLHPEYLKEALGSDKGDLLVFDGVAWQRIPKGTDGQVLTADDALALGLKYATVPSAGAPTILACGSDLQRVQPVAIAADPVLQLPVAANEIWSVDWVIFYEARGAGSGTADLVHRISGPTGSSGRSLVHHLDAATGDFLTMRLEEIALGAQITSGGLGLATFCALQIRSFVRIGASAGSVTFDWMPSGGSGEIATRRTDSHLIARKVA